MYSFINECYFTPDDDIENGFLWVKLCSDDTEKEIVALFEDGYWYFPGVDGGVEKELIKDIKSYRLIEPSGNFRDEFESIWLASGESEDRLIADESGKYIDKRAEESYTWFQLGSGKLDIN